MIECFDWCPLIKPNGQFNGLNIYNSFDDKGRVENWMNNRYDKEWRFRVNIRGDISLDWKSVRDVASNTTRRIIGSNTIEKKRSEQKVAFNCTLFTDKRLDCSIESYLNGSLQLNNTSSQVMDFYDNSVYIGPVEPPRKTKTKAFAYFEQNKQNPNQRSIIWFAWNHSIR